MKTIKLPCFGIVVVVDEDNHTGTIRSDFEGTPELDAIGSLVLAHACAGVNIEDFAYIEGIETAVDAIYNAL